MSGVEVWFAAFQSCALVLVFEVEFLGPWACGATVMLRAPEEF